MFLQIPGPWNWTVHLYATILTTHLHCSVAIHLDTPSLLLHHYNQQYQSVHLSQVTSRSPYIKPSPTVAMHMVHLEATTSFVQTSRPKQIRINSDPPYTNNINSKSTIYYSSHAHWIHFNLQHYNTKFSSPQKICRLSTSNSNILATSSPALEGDIFQEFRFQIHLP